MMLMATELAVEPIVVVARESQRQAVCMSTSLLRSCSSICGLSAPCVLSIQVAVKWKARMSF